MSIRKPERLEHAASDQLIDTDGSPLWKTRATTPTGHPFPTPAGEIESTDSRSPWRSWRREKKPSSGPSGTTTAKAFWLLEAAGLLPGTRVRVTGRTTMPPELELEVEGPTVGGRPRRGRPKKSTGSSSGWPSGFMSFWPHPIRRTRPTREKRP